ncbi:MAG: flagellar hook-associated protein FlgK [Desulfobulbaceae bacterium A2]|nr:MAG: flagellar hook-associated protein FlgK [Desulfobulbaceae bacterium A2]
MGGLLTALNAGKTSLSTNQKSLEIVGNNIANVNTPGYSRQRAELQQIPAVNFGDFFVGQGVTVSNVRRDYDIFVTRQLHAKASDYGAASGRSNALSEIERVVNIDEDSSIAAEIDKFFDAWQELTTNPSGLVERDTVIQRGQLLADTFHTVTNELDNIRYNINNTILSKVDSINAQLQEIADLNERIQMIEVSGQSANAARDQLDVLVEDLSTSLGAQTYTDSQGQTMVQLQGGLPLVSGVHAMELEADTSGADVQLVLHIGGTTKNLTLSNIGGEIGGMMETRDVFLQGVQDDLDTLAYNLTVAVNTQHQAGTGLNDNTSRVFFTALGTSTDAARNIEVALTDSSNVAAGSGTAVTGSEPGDNTNAQLIADLETSYLIGGLDTFDSYYSKIAADVGLEVQTNELAVGGTDDALTQLRNLRDGVSGVSLEEEMIDLIQYQRGFESSAKFLSTIDEMMAALLQMKG